MNLAIAEKRQRLPVGRPSGREVGRRIGRETQRCAGLDLLHIEVEVAPAVAVPRERDLSSVRRQCRVDLLPGIAGDWNDLRGGGRRRRSVRQPEPITRRQERQHWQSHDQRPIPAPSGWLQREGQRLSRLRFLFDLGERHSYVGHGLPAPIGILAQCSQDQLLEFLRHVGHLLRLFSDDRRQHGYSVIASERIRATARDFSRAHLAPHAAGWERTATFPRQALREMGKLGFMGVTVPAEWDGRDRLRRIRAGARGDRSGRRRRALPS